MDLLKDKENIYRLIKPKDLYIKNNKVKISSAAFVDPKGLSVEIQQGRQDRVVEAHLKIFFRGKISKTVKISTDVCDKFNINIYNDNSPNKFHRLLLDFAKAFDENGDNSLSDDQAFELAKNCKDLVY